MSLGRWPLDKCAPARSPPSNAGWMESMGTAAITALNSAWAARAPSTIARDSAGFSRDRRHPFLGHYILKHGLAVLTRLGIHTDAYGCQVGAGENDELVALARARCHQRSKELPKTGLAPLLLHTVTPLTVLFFCR